MYTYLQCYKNKKKLIINNRDEYYKRFLYMNINYLKLLL